MITNGSVTIYHKDFDNENKIEIWIRHNYDNIWWFGGKGTGINKGYDDANDVDIRIPYETNDINIEDISIGDILVKGSLKFNIENQQDLKNYEIYNVTSINDNNFGSRPHIHLGGK